MSYFLWFITHIALFFPHNCLPNTNVTTAPSSRNLPSVKKQITRIVGGHDTTIEEFPYQVSLQLKNAHFCGGAIVSEMYILTAAHCAPNKKEKAPMYIRAGSTYRDKGGQYVPVDEFVVHPFYNPKTTDYDLGIVKLYYPLRFSKSVRPVRLPEYSRQIQPGNQAKISGWGLTNEHGRYTDLPVTLQTATITVIDHRACARLYKDSEITERMICALDTNKDSCQGDSGGPLVVNDVLMGIVSWGQGCARPGIPGVYSYVPKFRDYIYYITSI